jgi:hypothetical protein
LELNGTSELFKLLIDGVEQEKSFQKFLNINFERRPNLKKKNLRS